MLKLFVVVLAGIRADGASNSNLRRHDSLRKHEEPHLSFSSLVSAAQASATSEVEATDTVVEGMRIRHVVVVDQANEAGRANEEYLQHRPKALFCYAVVPTNANDQPNKIGLKPLLATQLSAACDGWALFGETEDPANNVTKAFSREVVPHAMENDMREMVTLGVWPHLIERGALDEYEWFLKVDEDSFVRPSTLRKVFKSLHTSPPRDLFISLHDETLVDGFFDAVHADGVLAIQSMGWPAFCDGMLSGHDCVKCDGPAYTGQRMPMGSECLASLNKTRVDVGVLTDTEGRKLVSGSDCMDIGEDILQQARRHVKGPFCSGKLSQDFVSIHAVPDPQLYSELMAAYP